MTMLPSSIKADENLYGYINKENVKALTEHDSKASTLIVGENEYIFEINKEVVIKEMYRDTSLNLWYLVSFDELEAWVLYLDIDVKDGYDDYIRANFPLDYQTGLLELHKKYPTWQFVPMNTNRMFETVVEKESRKGVSLIDGTNLCYRSTESYSYNVDTQSWIALDGKNWYQANRETIAYFCDPRNFFNENRFFMFLSLQYHDIENDDAVQKALNNSFMSGVDNIDNETYASIFVQAGKENNVSPIYLAVLAIQEQGRSLTTSTSGNSFTYNNVTYSGLYNFFNIGATSSSENWKKGLVYANGGIDGSATSYNRPWTSPKKAIIGGAKFISGSYISVGQDTMYLQRFNVTNYSTYSHQYMTNVRAAYSQGNTMYYTYKNSNNLDVALTFKIPIYNGMPEKTELPTTYKLPEKEIVEEEDFYSGNIINDLSLVNYDNYLYGFTLGSTIESLKEQVKIISQKVTLIIKDVDGNELSDNTLLSTGQQFIFTDNTGTSTYRIIIKGDLNGDGRISLNDLLIMKKVILGTETLDAIKQKATSINNEETASLKGYLILKKYLLGVGEISQK